MSLLDTITAKIAQFEQALKAHTEHTAQLNQSLTNTQINMHRISGALEMCKDIAALLNGNPVPVVEDVLEVVAPAVDAAPTETPAA